MINADFSQLLKLLQSTSAGQSGTNDGLISLNNTEKGGKYNGLINGLIDTGVSLIGNYVQTLNNPSLFEGGKLLGIADATSNIALSTLSKAPGVAGLVGTALSLGNNLGGALLNKRFNKKLGDEVDIYNQTNAFGGLTAAQNINMQDKDVGNTLIGALAARKKRKNMLVAQDQLRKKGKDISGLLSKNKQLKADAFAGSEGLGQQTSLINSGFNYDDIQWGKAGMRIGPKPKEEKVKDIKPYKPLQLYTDSTKMLDTSKRNILKRMSEIYETQRDLSKQIKEVEKIINKKVEIKKEGGPINIIVEGLLHAHKHDLKTVLTFKDAKITEKGVPVILEDGGEITQTAEVERDELILHLDLTKQMELLMEEGTEEAMIEAGKILSKEIVKNTKDSKRKLLKNE